MTLGELREEVWNALARYDLALHPTPPHGHHPNFLGARRAAERLLKTPEFQGARRVLAGMDAVLKPLREEALRQGKELLLPHPDRPGEFLLLRDVDPRKLKRVREAYRFGVRVAQRRPRRTSSSTGRWPWTRRGAGWARATASPKAGSG